MKKIKMYWWKSKLNFGDAASEYLIKHLLPNHIIIWKMPQKKIHKEIRNSLRLLLKQGVFKFPDFQGYTMPYEKVLFVIGSILDSADSKTIVWGSGFREPDSLCGKAKILAVRGNLSKEKLSNIVETCNINIAVGDPALLLPLVYMPTNIKKNHNVKIIPHYSEYDYFFERYSDSYPIIDVRTTDIEHVINEILECDYILSSSLHGIIVSHAYGVPALWIKKGYIRSSSFKFHDYFSAVGINKYEGFEDIDLILSSEDNIMKIFCQNKDKSIIDKNNLKKIQKSLLDVFPYNIDFKKYSI